MISTFFFILKLIWQNSKDIRIRMILKTINSIIRGISYFLTPYYLALFLDNLQNDTNISRKYFFLFITWALITGICKFIYRNLFERTYNVIQFNLLHNYFIKIYNQNYLWHINNSTGYIASLVKKIGGNIKEIIYSIWYNDIPYITYVFMFIIFSGSISRKLSLYLILCTTLIIGIARLAYNKRIVLIKKQSDGFSNFDKRFIDFLYNIKTLKKLFIKDYAEKIIIENKNEIKPVYIALDKFNSFQWTLVDFGILVMFIIPIYYFYQNSVNNSQGIGILIILATAMNIFREFISKFMGFMFKVFYNKADFDLFREKVNKLSEIKTNSKILDNWNEIKFKNTFYSYTQKENTYTHKIEKLTINKGDKIGVIGRSGSGKTTFLNLITKNISPQTGEINIDKNNYEDLSETFFSEHVTYISQDIELFDMSLKDNILLGADISDNEIWRIIKGVHLEDLLERLNGNLDTQIGEKGVKVSAGERQRINIARGLVFQRDIMILDEITANLDKDTEDKIWSFLFEEWKNKTIIAVTHGDKILKYTNKIIRFENGRII